MGRVLRFSLIGCGVLAGFVLLVACDQASSPAERQEKKAGAEEAKPKEPVGEPTEQATVKCEDFSGREAAQEYLDTRATDADKKKIDPDDNGRACDEGAYIFAGSASGLSMSGEEQAAQVEANCRLLAYAEAEGMSQQEASDFSYQVANEMAEEMADDPTLTAGPAQNQVLDDLDVPRYPECKGGEE